jgi:hypothetical protein
MAVPSFGAAHGFARAGIVGADARPNWRGGAERSAKAMSRKRGISVEQRPTLRMLASAAHGCIEASMLAILSYGNGIRRRFAA